ncbi:centromere kinetochore component CENP-T-domain-containing protein [Peziza echinospora]|nr:centromere kinetochore component CENP-T-domain-containing protein [Peziza echinospora]
MADDEPTTPTTHRNESTGEVGAEDAHSHQGSPIEDVPFTALQNLAESLNRPTTANNNNADDSTMGDLTLDSMLTGSPTPFTPRRPTSSNPFRPSTTRRRTPGGSAFYNPTTLTPASTKPRQPPKSPHVIRAWETKRATTPGRERRRSLRRASHHYSMNHVGDGGGMGERDSPMDILRKLSQIVAPNSRPFYLDNTPTGSRTPSRRAPGSNTPKRNRRESGVVYYSEPEGGNDDDDDDDMDEEEDTPPPPPALSALSDPDARLDLENDAFTRRPQPRISDIPPRPSPSKSVLSNITPHRRRSSFRRLSSRGAGGIGSDDDNADDSMLLDSNDGDTTVDSIEHARRAAPLNSGMSFGWDFHLNDRFQDVHELGGVDPNLEQDAAARDAEDSMMDVSGFQGFQGVESDGEEEESGGGMEGLNAGDDDTVDLMQMGAMGGMALDNADEDDTETVNRDLAELHEDSLGVFQLPIPELGEDRSVEEGDEEEEGDAGGQEAQYDEDDSDDNAGEGFGDWGAASDDSDDDGIGNDNDDNTTELDTQVDPPEYYDSSISQKQQQNTGGKVPLPAKPPHTITGKTRAVRPAPRLSKHGHVIPTLPPRVVKKLAQTFVGGGAAGRSISGETLAAIIRASEAFFENVGESLGAFAEHAGRKTVFDSDVEVLLRRQRVVNDQTTVFSLAEKYLPRELLQEIKMPAPAPIRGSSQKKRGGPTKKVLGGQKARAGAISGGGKGKGKSKAVDGDEE